MIVIFRNIRVLLLWAWLGMRPSIAAGILLLGGSNGTPFSIVQTATTSTNTSSINTNTFSGLSIGAADPTRLVYVTLCHGPNNAVVSAFTIGGVTAAQATGSAFNSTGGVTCEIWGAAIPTGTTATVQFNYSSADTRTVIGVYSII